MTRLLRALSLGLLVLWSSLAAAHELSMAEMLLRETSRGEFSWQWMAGEKGSPADQLKPRWPEACVSEAQVLRCGPEGLRGRFAMDGVGQRYSAVMATVVWLDGQRRVYTLTAGQPQVQLYGSADDERGMGEIASAYTLLGIEHILTGYDHLAFVLALLFLVGFQRRLVATITAFTLAHSLTLALAATGWLTLRPPPVEATIALSIMLVAGEALHQRQTWSRRWPALVAFLFGLVHGLGFAGALSEIGLPQNHLAVALLTFNVGVEIGQLGVVAMAYALVRLTSAWTWPVRARVPALYLIGAVAGYWSISRVAGIFA